MSTSFPETCGAASPKSSSATSSTTGWLRTRRFSPLYTHQRRQVFLTRKWKLPDPGRDVFEWTTAGLVLLGVCWLSAELLSCLVGWRRPVWSLFFIFPRVVGQDRLFIAARGVAVQDAVLAGAPLDDFSIAVHAHILVFYGLPGVSPSL